MKRILAFLSLKLIAFVLTVASFIFLIEASPSLHNDYLYNVIGRGVYKITAPNEPRHGGTGFAVTAPSGNRYIATNAHVCEVAENGIVRVFVENSNKSKLARVIDRYDDSDLCLIEGSPDQPSLTVSDSSAIGNEVAIIGYPGLQPLTSMRGRFLASETAKVAYGFNVEPDKCSGKTFEWVDTSTNPMLVFQGIYSVCFRNIRSYVTNITSFGGNSGSPVVDGYGHVVGVLFAGSTRTNWGFVIPSQDLVKFLSLY